eukprot:CAMPEP_0194531940 /NCGR_PEP_ID=MMETSP0253-20130528/69332_1 /TAXON_ID=2966 /ORGANISM="Noctiluca scintillans" /LENGTH=46 /DNA_ID= /DNA_START= /DNA_END= /DNA_ORIENTATION=
MTVSVDPDVAHFSFAHCELAARSVLNSSHTHVTVPLPCMGDHGAVG